MTALVTAGVTGTRKLKGERDTTFIKRIVATYINMATEEEIVELVEALGYG